MGLEEVRSGAWRLCARKAERTSRKAVFDVRVKGRGYPAGGDKQYKPTHDLALTSSSNPRCHELFRVNYPDLTPQVFE